jgi:outer membrane protein assembly factor BamB
MMKKLTILIVTVMLTATALAQPPIHVLTRPLPPARDVLDRLNLAQGWRSRIPLHSGRDGIFSAQLIPGADGMQLVVQTRYGSVVLLDAETGDTLWRTSVGLPYWEAQPVAYNSSSIFTTRRDMLYVLSRKTGAQRVFTIDRDSKLPNYGMKLLGAPSSAAVADESGIFFCMESRITGYLLPPYGDMDKFQAEKGNTEDLHVLDHIEYVWTRLMSGQHFDRPPILATGRVVAVSTEGLLLSLARLNGTLQEDYQFNKRVSAGMGQHGDMGYIGCDDYSLYAMDVTGASLRWRFLGGAPIQRQPAVTDRDVFVSPYRRGLYRLDRDSGFEKWWNRKAERFLSANQKFVYAVDSIGKLLVLDYARGTELAHYDISDYVLPITNEWTDRIYFANHDGQVLCLRYRDNPTPLRTKYADVERPPVKPKEEKKPAPPPGDARRNDGRSQVNDYFANSASGSSIGSPCSALTATASVNSMYVTPLAKSVN